MQKADYEVTDFQQIIEIIQRCDVCRLALHDTEYPYILPLNFGIRVEKEQITFYFHGAMKGKKYQLLEKNNIPFIIFGKSYDEKNIYVSNDDFNSSFEATNYLLEKQLREIVFISADSTPMNEQRVKGVVEAYRKNQIDERLLQIERGINTSQDVKEIVKKYKNNLPQCFFVSGDEKAIVLMRELFNVGIKVPKNVKVMGFDNLPLSQYTIPSLTTVSMNYKELAEKLLTKLLNIMDNKPEISEEIESKLIIRESTI